MLDCKVTRYNNLNFVILTHSPTSHFKKKVIQEKETMH